VIAASSLEAPVAAAAAGASMIAKTYFLVKIIHRIDARNLRGKKSLPKIWRHIVHYPHFGQAAGSRHVPRFP
jgi:hypothetical protein